MTIRIQKYVLKFERYFRRIIDTKGVKMTERDIRKLEMVAVV